MSKLNDDNHQPPPSQPPPPPQPSLFYRITTVDETISHTIHTLSTPIIPTTFLKLLELTGDGRLWFPLTLSLFLSPLSLHAPPLYSLSLSLLAGLVTDIIAVGLLKHLVRRRRPSHNNHPMPSHLPVDRWSFPSGHASRVLFIATFFDLEIDTIRGGIDQVLVRDPEILRRWIGDREVVAYFVGGFWAWAVVTAVSRVLLGRHYVIDVVVGSLVGVINALFVHHFLRF
ncbi:hypothetical protein RND81_13G051000 [Saponaria officinalis]|uniref:Phosphatidic acid phosphatase type 2/haloperoxidase domain-containing protein n=1 Tax=Saponaria officinalis TaxID=3572 RepID=A0AAW1GWY7_SAPOF